MEHLPTLYFRSVGYRALSAATFVNLFMAFVSAYVTFYQICEFVNLINFLMHLVIYNLFVKPVLLFYIFLAIYLLYV